MAIKMKELDLDRLRGKLEKLKNPRASQSKRPLWKPDKDQVSKIRLIQYPHGDDPFLELWFHYRVGDGENQNFLCPKKNFGKTCVVCEMVSKLFDSKEPGDADLAKKIVAKQRIYAVVIDRADKTCTPKFWGFGKMVYKRLLGCFEDEEYAGFLDLYAGLDLKIDYEVPEEKDAFPKTTISFNRKDSALAEDDDAIQQILDKIPKIETVYQPITKSQVQEQLNGWLHIDEDTVEEVSSETVKGATPEGKKAAPEKAKAAEPESSMSDVDAAFEEALG